MALDDNQCVVTNNSNSLNQGRGEGGNGTQCPGFVKLFRNISKLSLLILWNVYSFWTRSDTDVCKNHRCRCGWKSSIYGNLLYLKYNFRWKKCSENLIASFYQQRLPTVASLLVCMIFSAGWHTKQPEVRKTADAPLRENSDDWNVIITFLKQFYFRTHCSLLNSYFFENRDKNRRRQEVSMPMQGGP